MPSSAEILEQLARAASEAVAVAVAWHVVAFGSLLAVALGWRPSARLCGWLLTGPLLSVAIVAAMLGNPFNGLVFGGLAVASFVLAWRLERRPVAPGRRWQVVLGGAVAAFGWVYPHFMGDAPLYSYAVAAPTGVLPCPTLALVIGLGLVAGGLGSRAWSLVLALGGLFYGMMGVTSLGVTIDGGLVAGALALLVTALLRSQLGDARSPRAHASLAGATAAAARG